MLATSATELPRGEDWSYEVTWDGYRAIALKDGERVRLLSRNLKDMTTQYPMVAHAIQEIDAEATLLDGEVVALD